MANDSKALAKIEQQSALAARVDELAGNALALLRPQSFAQSLALARSVQDIRALLTPELMEPVMELANTPLGFLTDRASGEELKKYGPYTVEQIKDVLIEATIRGYHPVGNEFNVIKGRFYAAKAGVRRKVLELVTDFRESYGVPLAKNGGAVVACKAEWKRDGKPDALEAEIPVRENAGMGADAILGKAQRKFLARILDRVTGVQTPDGEVDDGAIDATYTEARAAAPPPSSPPPTKERARRGAPADAPAAPSAPPANDAEPTGAPPASVPATSPPAPARGDAAGTDKPADPVRAEAEAIAAELHSAATWSVVAPLGQRARKLPPEWQDFILASYVGAVINLCARPLNRVEFDSAVAEMGRLRKENALTPEELKRATETINATTKRLAAAPAAGGAA